MRLAALILLTAVAGAGCTGREPRTYTVTIAGMAYGPSPAGLRAGDVIQWVNADLFRHTATATDGSFDVDLTPRASARTVLRGPARVRFFCRYHPGMTGVLAIGA